MATAITFDALRSNKEAEAREKHKRKVQMNDLTSDQKPIKDYGLNTLFCRHCGEFVLILGKALEDLPHRGTDGSSVARKDQVKKSRMQEQGLKRIKRVKGIERQYRLQCPACALFVAYRSTADEASAKLLYILPDALTAEPSVLHVDASNGVGGEEPPKGGATASAQSTSSSKSPRTNSSSKRPNSIREASDVSSTTVVVMATGGASVSAVKDVGARFVTVELRSSNEESKLNRQLQIFFGELLGKSSSDVTLNWGSIADTTHVVVNGVIPDVAHQILVRAATASVTT